jgi:hypothetical protein
MEGEPVDPETDSSLVQAFHLNSRTGATGKGLVTDATGYLWVGKSELPFHPFAAVI